MEDKKECECNGSGPICGAKYNGKGCTRTRDHLGDHIACGVTQCNILQWDPIEDQPDWQERILYTERDLVDFWEGNGHIGEIEEQLLAEMIFYG